MRFVSYAGEHGAAWGLMVDGGMVPSERLGADVPTSLQALIEACVGTPTLASTLAGNLILVGSIANLIVVDRAAAAGVRIDWRTHARIGVPVTLATLALAAAWLWLIG